MDEKTEQTEQTEHRQARSPERHLDRETFLKLVDEGRELRLAFESAAVCTRVITAHDMKFRSR